VSVKALGKIVRVNISANVLLQTIEKLYRQACCKYYLFLCAAVNKKELEMSDKDQGQDVVEKSFNDDELADIMNEIESLEKEFEPAPEAESVEAAPEEEFVEAAPEEFVEAAPEEEFDEAASEEEFVEAAPEEVIEQVAPEPTPVVEEIVEEVSEQPAVGPVTQAVSDPVEQVFEEKTSEIKEVVAELSEMPAPAEAHVESKVHHISEHKKDWTPSASETSMSFKVEGDMKLTMSFFVSGKEFSVCVDEKEGFVIELDGGAQFKVPIDQAQKKVA
jgi:hypothetical protein